MYRVSIVILYEIVTLDYWFDFHKSIIVTTPFDGGRFQREQIY